MRISLQENERIIQELSALSPSGTHHVRSFHITIFVILFSLLIVAFIIQSVWFVASMIFFIILFGLLVNYRGTHLFFESSYIFTNRRLFMPNPSGKTSQMEISLDVIQWIRRHRLSEGYYKLTMYIYNKETSVYYRAEEIPRRETNLPPDDVLYNKIFEAWTTELKRNETRKLFKELAFDYRLDFTEYHPITNPQFELYGQLEGGDVHFSVSEYQHLRPKAKYEVILPFSSTVTHNIQLEPTAFRERREAKKHDYLIGHDAFDKKYYIRTSDAMGLQFLLKGEVLDNLLIKYENATFGLKFGKALILEKKHKISKKGSFALDDELVREIKEYKKLPLNNKLEIEMRYPKIEMDHTKELLQHTRDFFLLCLLIQENFFNEYAKR